MNSFSGVWPSRYFAASLSKSSNSRSRIGITWPGTSSRTSGLVSDPARPVVVEGSIHQKVLNPSGFRTFPTRSTGKARPRGRDRGRWPPTARRAARATGRSPRARAAAPCRAGTARPRRSPPPPPPAWPTSRAARAAGAGSRSRPVDRAPAALDRVAPARGRLERARPALDRAQAPHGHVERAAVGLDHAVAVVVEVGLVDPRVDAAQRVDDRRRRVRVLVVAGDDHAAPRGQVDLPQALGGDRAGDELRRRRLTLAHLSARLAGDERVDVAGDEHDVLDVVLEDVLEQVLALARVALPAVVGVVRAAQDLGRHHRHLVADDLPRRLRAPQLLLEEAHLLVAEERAGLLPFAARRSDRVV